MSISRIDELKSQIQAYQSEISELSLLAWCGGEAPYGGDAEWYLDCAESTLDGLQKELDELTRL